MLIGQHIVKVGDKNRIAFPKKMRSEMGDTLIISYGFEKAIMVFAKDKWEKVIREIDEMTLLQRSTRDIKRFLIGGATEVECDLQGRFVLPQYITEFGHIRDEIVVIGMGHYAEIWDRKVWDKQRENTQKDIEEIAQSIVDKAHE